MSTQTYNHSPDTAINFEVTGSGLRSLIFLHGFGASLETWRDVQPFLKLSARMYFLDLKGFGLSSKPHDGQYSLEDQADIITGFIAKYRLNDVVLVGHSYGGGVALVTFLSLVDSRQAELISGIILIDTASYPQGLPFF